MDQLAAKAAKQLGNPEGDFMAFIFPANARKTLPQLGYYFAVVLEDIANATGYFPDEIHKQNKVMYGTRETVVLMEDGLSYELVTGLSKMGKEGASRFIDRVIHHWVSKGVYIRAPHELTELEYMIAHLRETNDE